MPFDPDSGVVFDEVILKKPRKRHQGGVLHCIGRPPDCRSSGHGTDSLFEVALRRLLSNLDMLVSTSLSTVPEALLKRVWKTVLRSQLDSLHVWRVFAQSEIGERRIVEDHTSRAIDVGTGIELAIHPHCTWITTLDISTEKTSRQDLIRVSEFQNLRSIHIATRNERSGGEGLDDRVLKTWAEQSQKKGAFECLRFVFLYLQEGITQWSLGRLSAFPALEEFCAYRCSIDQRLTATLSGWRRDTQNGFAGFIKSSRQRNQGIYAGAQPNISWYSLIADYLNSRTAKSQDPLDLRPILNVAVKRASQDLCFDRLDEIICLQRFTEAQKDGGESHQKPKSSTTSTSRPAMKKRKLVTSSTALEDMM